MPAQERQSRGRLSEGTPGARLRDQRGNRKLGGLCASITPRYQTATFRPVRPPVLPAYAPVDRMPVRVAENGVRIGRRGDALRSSTWQSLCSTPWSWTRRSSRCAAISGCWPEVSEPLTSGPSYHPLSPWRAAAGLKLTRTRRRSPTRSLRKNPPTWTRTTRASLGTCSSAPTSRRQTAGRTVTRARSSSIPQSQGRSATRTPVL